MSHRSLQTPAYSNWLMISPEGEEMCRCAKKRADWYISRGLADVVANDPPTIKLKFLPNGNGNQGDPFSLANKHNRCVVCGTEEDLTKHHIIPSMYRKFFPIKYKARSAHDVVVICIPCHEEYETIAMSLKQTLSIEMTGSTIPIHKPCIKDRDHFRITGYCKSLLTHGDVIPHERKVQMVAEVASYIGHIASMEEIEKLAKIKRESYGPRDVGKAVVDCLTDDDKFEAFVKRWRKHFIDTAQPKFMPEHWSVDRTL